MELILASKSPRRRALLEQMGLRSFKIVTPDIDEHMERTLSPAELVGRIYVPATDECLPFRELVKLADEVGAILCYPYLGDVTNSVTGDKKAAKFEDDFLDELFEMLKEEGVHGVTYMPARNTREQLTRLQELCRRYGMTEISGEDVNSSRQSMICPQLADPQFEHLVDMAWKLVEREKD